MIASPLASTTSPEPGLPPVAVGMRLRCWVGLLTNGVLRRASRQNQRLRQVLLHRATAHWRRRACLALATGGAAVVVAAHALWSLAVGGPPGTAGTVVAAAAIVGLLAAPLRDLGRGVAAWVMASMAREGLSEFQRDAAPCHALPHAKAARICTLQFDGAALARRVGPIDAVVPYGRRVAVYGPPDSGKSSLMRLASGLVAPSEGLLLLDDMELCTLDPVNLRERIALVAPHFSLLPGTMGSNLRHRCAQSADDRLQDACSTAGLTPLLARMPEGLRTAVRDGGLNLSLDERRALQLARALAGRPSVLLIDDVHACLPGDAEMRLAAVLLSFDGTVIYSTTDVSLALMADEVWFLDMGCRVAAWPVPRRSMAPTVGSRQLH